MGDKDLMNQTRTAVAAPAAVASEPSGVAAPRRWFRVFLVAGLVMAAVAVIGLIGPALGYLVLDPLTRHVGLALTVSLALFFVAAIVMPLTPGWRNVTRVLVAIGLGFAMSLVLLLTAWAALFGESRYESPDGLSIVVADEASFTFDPFWDVTVQQSSPLLARTWHLGCFNGDNFDNGLASIRWISSTVVEAQTESGQTFQITIDRDTSEPSTTISSGCWD